MEQEVQGVDPSVESSGVPGGVGIPRSSCLRLWHVLTVGVGCSWAVVVSLVARVAMVFGSP